MGERQRLIPMTFADNATTSGEVDLTDELSADEAIVGIDIHADFIGTSLSFTNAVDQVTFRAVLKEDGTSYALVVAANSYVQMNPGDTKGFARIKGIAASQTSGPVTIYLVASRVA